MAPNKFEKHIKKQLQQREIQPSANAWERLSEKLDEQGPESKKKGYFWYGIAASVIGLLIISITYFNAMEEYGATKIQVADSATKNRETNILPKKKQEKNIEEMLVEHNKISQGKIAAPTTVELDKNRVEIDKVILKMDDTLHTKSLENFSIESIEQVKIVLVDKKVRLVETAKTDEILNNKILEVIAQVDSIEKQNIDLTDLQVDSLLRFAQKEIMTNKIFLNENRINPMALLTEVEDELDQSFRDKIFERLRTGFAKERTAVADRDN